MLAERLDVSCESLKYTKLLLLLLLYWVHPNSEVNNPLNSTEASSLLSSLLPICGSDVVAQRGPARGPAPVLLILSVGTFLDKSVFCRGRSTDNCQSSHYIQNIFLFPRARGVESEIWSFLN